MLPLDCLRAEAVSVVPHLEFEVFGGPVGAASDRGVGFMGGPRRGNGSLHPGCTHLEQSGPCGDAIRVPHTDFDTKSRCQFGWTWVTRGLSTPQNPKKRQIDRQGKNNHRTYMNSALPYC